MITTIKSPPTTTICRREVVKWEKKEELLEVGKAYVHTLWILGIGLIRSLKFAV
jgi:hypothetical protein